MYIPTSFFSSQGACITATTTAIAGNGIITTGSFVSESISWSYVQFQTTDYTDPTFTSFTASLNILTGSTNQAKLLIVGAGGAGGSGASPAGDFAAGGGGGGGVLYYNNFPITSGTYEIGVGGATTQISSYATGSNGKNSYIKLPNNLTYTPFTSSFLTAFGGGGGGYGQVDGTLPITCLSQNGGPGPTTGGVGTISGTPCNGGTATSTIYTTLNGITLAPQGFKGGDVANSSPDFGLSVATGGGGAATTGSNLSKNQMIGGLYATNGGNGLQFNMNGTPTYFSPGGGGQANGGTGATGLGGDTYGRGGQGERDGNTTSVNFGFGGVVIIAWPICLYPVIPPVPPAPTKPNILSGSILTAWQWAPNYTASATVWNDSSIYNNTSQFRLAGGGTAVSMSVSGSSILFNNNRMVYQTYPMTATPSSSYSLNVYGEFNSGSTKYPLFANATSDNNDGWDFALYRDGSTPYISYKTSYKPNPFATNGVTVNTPLLNNDIFTGSNLLTINVNTNAITRTGSIDVYVNGLLNSSSISASYIRTFDSGSGNNQFGAAYEFPSTYYLNNSKIKDTMIYNRVLTQAEILSNYNALTSSV